LQDGFLLAMAMIVTILLALECDLFSFVAELSEPHGKISLAEAIFLTALLALCIVAFVIRRSREERRDVVRQVTDKIRLQEFKREASQDSLTSLANRRSILDALNAATASPSSVVAFPLIDLNDFTMAIDPKKIREIARVCATLAKRAPTAEEQTSLPISL
jgi:predicted signal transduction protein with EAL and GGDEF domain